MESMEKLPTLILLSIEPKDELTNFSHSKNQLPENRNYARSRELE